MKRYFVYILASRSRVLYIGITSDLARRIAEHRGKEVPGFTLKYNVNKLIYIESFDNPRVAIAREKQIKAWRREKKLKLIATLNPNWTDLGDTMVLR